MTQRNIGRQIERGKLDSPIFLIRECIYGYNFVESLVLEKQGLTVRSFFRYKEPPRVAPLWWPAFYKSWA